MIKLFAPKSFDASQTKPLISLFFVKFNLVVKCIILASPGFLREQFFEFMIQTATRQEKRVFLENKSKFMLVHSSSGHKHALKEVLTDSVVMSKLVNTKATSEVTALNDFYQMLKTDQSRAFYGYVVLHKHFLNFIYKLVIIQHSLLFVVCNDQPVSRL